MDNSVYITLSRQLAQFEDLAITANNIANVNTPGFSAQKMVFNQYLVDSNSPDKKDAYANNPYSYRDTTSGSMKQTGNALDVAINGPGYFTVETAAGRRYTKAGNFTLNADGQIITPSGNYVLGSEGGRITIPQGTRTIEINGAGQIVADGQNVGQLGVVEFAQEQALKREGNSLYNTTDAPLPPTTSRVAQGILEGSNVNPVSELVRVMEVSRSVGNTAKFIDTIYDLERKVSSTFTRSQTA